MEIELRNGSAEVALRNEEVNRKRMQQGTNSGGPLKVTDPAAMARLLEEMRHTADKQRELEQQREAERARREGAAYKTPEERAGLHMKHPGVTAQTGEEARSLDGPKLDPKADYYAALGLDRAASAAEVRRAYKRLALLYHPDKYKSKGEDEQAAVAARFGEVTAAFDILVDEPQRALYDKVRDHMAVNPGKGLPPLTPEEAAMLRSGAAELSRMRRAGPKLGKHPPLERDLPVSLHELNAGCTKAITVERCRVDYTGQAFLSSKTFHVVVRRGSREGDRQTFPDEGNESVDTHAGNLEIVLRASQAPHPSLRRCGEKDLETFAAAVPRGDVVSATEIETIHGVKRLVVVPALAAALRAGGVGGVWRAVLPGQGLYDAAQPWERPPGDMHVHVRFSAVLLAECQVRTCLHLAPICLIGCSRSGVAGAMVGGVLAAALCHRSEAMHMAADCCGAPPGLQTVSLRIVGGDDAELPATSSTAASLLQVLRSRVPRLSIETAVLCSERGVLDDTAWCALHTADCILVEVTLPDTGGEDFLLRVRQQLQECGVLAAIFQRAWTGCRICAIGQGCAVLGAGGGKSTAPVLLPWYVLRAGEEGEGWAALHAAMAAESAGVSGVGVLASSAWVVDPVTGFTELVVAPCKEQLVAAAHWTAQHDAEAAGLSEAEDDFGYYYAVCQSAH